MTKPRAARKTANTTRRKAKPVEKGGKSVLLAFSAATVKSWRPILDETGMTVAEYVRSSAESIGKWANELLVSNARLYEKPLILANLAIAVKLLRIVLDDPTAKDTEGTFRTFGTARKYLEDAATRTEAFRAMKESADYWKGQHDKHEAELEGFYTELRGLLKTGKRTGGGLPSEKKPNAE